MAASEFDPFLKIEMDNFGCVTLGIAILGGICSGFIASRIPFTENFFDDSAHFSHVDFNNDIAKYNTSTEYAEAAVNDVSIS